MSPVSCYSQSVPPVAQKAVRAGLNHAIPLIPAPDAARMLLHAQGLLDDPSRPATARSLGQLIQRLGFVQLDSINVVERAHHLTLFSRMEKYQPSLLDDLLRKRRIFEHWTHDAALIPMEFYPHWKLRFERYRAKLMENAWWRSRIGTDPESLLQSVRERIAADGPLFSRDFEHDPKAYPQPEPATPAEKGWWGWKPQKAALEHLWRIGELTIVARTNFQKQYDLTPRVLPEHHRTAAPSDEEHVEWACAGALDRLGFATPGEVAAYWHAVKPPQATHWCRDALAQGRLVPVSVASMDGSAPRTCIAWSDWKNRLRRARGEVDAERIRLLSPFDPVLRNRDRALRLFNFDYRFEAFTPAPKRKYGYYVLPIMQGDQLIGRLDPKFHRERGGGTLEIRNVWWEPGHKPTKSQRRSLNDAVERLAGFIGAERIEMRVRRDR